MSHFSCTLLNNSIYSLLELGSVIRLRPLDVNHKVKKATVLNPSNVALILSGAVRLRSLIYGGKIYKCAKIAKQIRSR